MNAQVSLELQYKEMSMACYSRFDALKDTYKKGRNKGKKIDNFMGKWVLVEVHLICTFYCSMVILIFLMFCFVWISS